MRSARGCRRGSSRSATASAAANPSTLEFDREDTALRVLFELGAEGEIVKPRSLRQKLHRQAAKIVAAATRN